MPLEALACRHPRKNFKRTTQRAGRADILQPHILVMQAAFGRTDGPPMSEPSPAASGDTHTRSEMIMSDPGNKCDDIGHGRRSFGASSRAMVVITFHADHESRLSHQPAISGRLSGRLLRTSLHIAAPTVNAMYPNSSASTN
jgi:hypothetical protein